MLGGGWLKPGGGWFIIWLGGGNAILGGGINGRTLGPPKPAGCWCPLACCLANLSNNFFFYSSDALFILYFYFSMKFM